MPELELVRTLILSAPNLAGMVVAIYYMSRLTNRLLDIVEKCDCGDEPEAASEDTQPYRPDQISHET